MQAQIATRSARRQIKQAGGFEIEHFRVVSVVKLPAPAQRRRAGAFRAAAFNHGGAQAQRVTRSHRMQPFHVGKARRRKTIPSRYKGCIRRQSHGNTRCASRWRSVRQIVPFAAARDRYETTVGRRLWRSSALPPRQQHTGLPQSPARPQSLRISCDCFHACRSGRAAAVTRTAVTLNRGSWLNGSSSALPVVFVGSGFPIGERDEQLAALHARFHRHTRSLLRDDVTQMASPSYRPASAASSGCMLNSGSGASASSVCARRSSRLRASAAGCGPSPVQRDSRH